MNELSIDVVVIKWNIYNKKTNNIVNSSLCRIKFYTEVDALQNYRLVFDASFRFRGSIISSNVFDGLKMSAKKPDSQ